MISAKPDIAFEITDQMGGKLVCHYYFPPLTDAINRLPIQNHLSEYEAALRSGAESLAKEKQVSIESVTKSFDEIISQWKRDYAVRIEYGLRAHLKEAIEMLLRVLVGIITNVMALDAVEMSQLAPEVRNREHKKHVSSFIGYLARYLQKIFQAGPGRQFVNAIDFFFRFWDAVDVVRKESDPVMVEDVALEMGYSDASGLRKALRALGITFDQAVADAQIRNTLRYTKA